jgi:Icc-related predicted phosphoesterase
MVRVLAVSDMEERTLSEHFNKSRWKNEKIELIVSCGDLKPSYLDYLVSVFDVPCFYVRGNHDTTYNERNVGACLNLDRHVESFRGVKFFGLEGSRWYNGGPAQYTEREMWWRVFWARLTLMQSGGADVYVAHNPPRICPLPEKQCLCINPPAGREPNKVGATCYVDPERMCWDMADVPHRGFDVFHHLIMKQQPRFFLHGHTHLGYGARPREFQLGRTRVIDVYGHVILDV